MAERERWQDMRARMFGRHLITLTASDTSLDSGISLNSSFRSEDELLQSSSRSGGRRLENGSIIGSYRSVLSRGESLQQSSLTFRSSSSRQTVPSQSGSLSVSEGLFNEDLLERMHNNQTSLKIVVLGGPKTGKITFARNFVAESDLGLDENEAYGSTRREHFERFAAIDNAAVEIWVGPSIQSDAKSDYVRKIKEEIGDWHEDHVLFIILSGDNVSKTDEFLAKSLTEVRKIFFFVRTHFDTEQGDGLNQVKMGIEAKLVRIGIESNDFEVFVIDCRRVADWDFRVLKRRLCEEAEVDRLKQKAAAYKEQRRKNEPSQVVPNNLGICVLLMLFALLLFCFRSLLLCEIGKILKIFA